MNTALPRPPPSTPMTAASEPINILLVDDEPANLIVLETVLERPDYRLVRAHSADQALLALVEGEFALLILDIHMPGMSGFELAQLVKERKKTAHVPIIFLTAYYDKDQHVLEGYGSGAVDFLSKPVNPAVLRSKVAVFADLHRKDREIRQSNRALQLEVEERRLAEERLRELADTLEQRVAERSLALRAADRRLQSVVASITDGLAMLDQQWRFSYVNEPASLLLNTEPARMQGYDIWDVFPQLRGSEFEQGLRRAVQEGRSLSFEAHFPGDAQRWLQCHCYPTADGLSVYFHDISDRRELEARREQMLGAEQAARGEGERLARAKDEFLAMLSHELRTPMAAIMGWVNVLLRPGRDAGTVQRGVEAIARNARLQTQLVSDLLDMSRIGSGKLALNLERVDLNSVAATVGETARISCAEKALRFELRLEKSAGMQIMGDPTRLMQIVGNVVTNAVKFTPAGGVVTIATTRNDDWVELSVSDTGQGIAAEFLPHLFDRFSQADGSAARLHGGLGLGLSIVKSLMESHAGEVLAASEGIGEGAVFTLRFPCAPAGAAAVPAEHNDGSSSSCPAHAELLTDLQGVHVLLVEDHADVLEVERRVLSELGAIVTTATSGESALQRLEAERFDLLLSDLGMPGMDGYELIRTVRERLGLSAEQLPAAAITAFVREQDQERAIASGFQRCIQKPVTQSSLAKIARDLVRTKGLPMNDAAQPLAARSLRALFVEDNAELREQIGWLLAEEGLDVHPCSTAEEALETYEQSAFDVLITDVSLPKMNGVDLARKVLARDPSAWVIFSTGYSAMRPLKDLGRHVRVLCKPFELDDLHDLINEVRAGLQSPA